MSRRVLVARLDSIGDLLISGPAIRAVAAGSTEVVLLCGPRGRAVADLLPGVDRVICWTAPWIEPDGPPVTPAATEGLVCEVRDLDVDEAVVLTSFHQSALPLALLLRLAGVRRISAISEDYPGSLLDVRVPPPGDAPEALRMLAVAEAAGFSLPTGEHPRLAVRGDLPDVRTLTGPGPYLVVHPGTSVSARAWPAQRWVETVRLLVSVGYRVVVTGAPEEAALTALVAGEHALDLGGKTDLAELASVIAAARAIVVANTGPAHLAAAVGTPVVSLFAPTVPAHRWAPYGVPVVLLGDQVAACRDSRATTCPVPGHPCLASVSAEDVYAALVRLEGELSCAS